MSFQHTKAVWSLELQNPSTKLVALALADMANEEGVCWPAAGTIAQRCCMEERTARHHVMLLRRMGVVASSPRFFDNRQSSNLYRFARVAANGHLLVGASVAVNGKGDGNGVHGEVATSGKQNLAIEPPMEESFSLSSLLLECPEPKLSGMDVGGYLNHPEYLTDDECEKYWPYLMQFIDGRKNFYEEFPDMLLDEEPPASHGKREGVPLGGTMINA